MKCKECGREVYYKESEWTFVFLLIVILGSYFFESLEFLFFMAMGSLGISYILNSQKVCKTKQRSKQ